MNNPIDNFKDPLLDIAWGELGVVRRAARLDDRWHVDAVLGYPVEGLAEVYTEALSASLGDEVVLDLTFAAPSGPPQPGQADNGVRNVIAVASGKGGVGKSTTAVNLALGLDRAGAKTGLLDADIYGPSQGIMLGIAEGRRPEIKDEKFFVPIKAHGIEALSMSMLVTEKTPMIWRGPMASGAFQQLFGQTAWGGLDYLVIDMPPGTGDILLTLSQKVRLGGAVVVTTPQDIALADVRKAIEMFGKVNVPILGIVENMSYFTCGECNAVHHPFGQGGGARLAEEYDTRLLAEFPLDTVIREQTDGGTPTVMADDGELKARYIDFARLAAAELWRASLASAGAPVITMDEQ